MNLVNFIPTRKQHTFYLNGKAQNVLSVEKGMERISKHFEFNLNDTEELHKCKHIFDMVLLCCQQFRKNHNDPNEFEEAFQLFRKSHTWN